MHYDRGGPGRVRSVAFSDSQGRYTDLYGCVEDTLEEQRSEEDARLEALAKEEQARLKAIKVQQLNAKWMAAHQHIDTILDEIKTRLEGDPINSLELLTVKRNQLMAVKEYLRESASLVDSMFNEDREQP